MKGEEVVLEEMLACRERRAAIQEEMRKQHHATQISFCMNIPGPIKTNEAIRKAFDKGLESLKRSIGKETGHILEEWDIHEKTGDEAILEVDLLDVKSLLASAVEKGKVKHEMALEAATIAALGKESTLTSLLGPWDYISHQVAASPCKPVAYMDHIDVFAMRYLPGSTIVGKYLVVELKKGKAEKKDIDQIMKYTDWVCHEYAFGNYEAITSCLIASDFPPDISSYSSKVATRYYTSGSHPVENKDWHDMHLLRYRWEKGNITYDSFA